MNQHDDNDLWADTDLIHSYSRAQAIEDGELVDVSELASEAGFTVSSAVTAALWAAIETIPQRYGCEDITGRTWDVVWMAYNAARRSRQAAQVEFEVILHTDESQTDEQHHIHRLVLHIGPGDEAEPVITIGYPLDF